MEPIPPTPPTPSQTLPLPSATGTRSRSTAVVLGIAEDLYDPPNTEYDAFKPDVVLATFGADDINFAKFLESCYKSVIGHDRLSRYCDKDATLNAEVDKLLARQAINAKKVVEEIIKRGQADGKVPLIILTTYYDPFPKEYVKCADIVPALDTFGLSKGEVSWLRSKLNVLNGNIRAVAAAHPEVELVDLQNAFDGHRWCSKDPWIYGASIRTQPGLGQNPSPFHPTWYGQTVISNMVTVHVEQRLK